MIKRLCDKCKREIDCREHYYHADITMGRNGQMDHFVDFDLCKDCMNEIMETTKEQQNDKRAEA